MGAAVMTSNHASQINRTPVVNAVRTSNWRRNRPSTAVIARPALSAAGLLEAVTAADGISARVGWGATAVGTVISFVVAYASIAWLLKYVSRHSIVTFVWYRLGLAALLIAALATGVLAAT